MTSLALPSSVAASLFLFFVVLKITGLCFDEDFCLSLVELLDSSFFGAVLPKYCSCCVHRLIVRNAERVRRREERERASRIRLEGILSESLSQLSRFEREVRALAFAREVIDRKLTCASSTAKHQ